MTAYLIAGIICIVAMLCYVAMSIWAPKVSTEPVIMLAGAALVIAFLITP